MLGGKIGFFPQKVRNTHFTAFKDNLGTCINIKDNLISSNDGNIKMMDHTPRS